MPETPLNPPILVHLANTVRGAANEIGWVCNAVYGMDDPAIREALQQPTGWTTRRSARPCNSSTLWNGLSGR